MELTPEQIKATKERNAKKNKLLSDKKIVKK